jgi:hypothetical protein
MINLNKLVALSEPSESLTDVQNVLLVRATSDGWEAYLEAYSDYAYLVLVKETRNGIKRINRTGHNTYE